MKLNFFLVMALLLSQTIHAEEAKKVEVKKEEPKKEEPKKEEPKKEEPKKEEPKKEDLKRPKECFYKANSLAVIEHEKFEEEVKKIKEDFEKCEAVLLHEKEREAKQVECKKMRDEFKTKKTAFNKLVFSSKTSSKDEFEKTVQMIKAAKEDLLKDENKLNDMCPKKKESKKVEVKKERIKESRSEKRRT